MAPAALGSTRRLQQRNRAILNRLHTGGHLALADPRNVRRATPVAFWHLPHTGRRLRRISQGRSTRPSVLGYVAR